MGKNVHPVFGAANPQHSERESLPITTRLGLDKWVKWSSLLFNVDLNLFRC